MTDLLYTVYSVVTVGNIFLLLVLSYIFVQDYMKVRSKFTIGLVLFAGLLLLKALISCPIISLFFFGSTCSYMEAEVRLEAYAALVQFLGLLVFTYIVIR
ncbi:MAG: hypothetical protein GXO65_06890 [Euryarchaeota archaeon]|nr:hypothetical protein [Euryarchaeota archaeon]